MKETVLEYLEMNMFTRRLKVIFVLIILFIGALNFAKKSKRLN